MNMVRAIWVAQDNANRQGVGMAVYRAGGGYASMSYESGDTLGASAVAVCFPRPARPAQFPCTVCGSEIGWAAPSGVCSTVCLKAGQGFANVESEVLRLAKRIREESAVICKGCGDTCDCGEDVERMAKQWVDDRD